MTNLFRDGTEAAQGLETTAESVRGSVSEARSAVSQLESALREASDTPVIGGAIGALASTAGDFESELGELSSAARGI